MRALITGGGGLLAGEVARVLRRRGDDVELLAHAELDVADEAAVRETFERLRPDAVAHCAAMTNVDACEENPGRAYAVNADGSGHVAAAAADLGAEVVAVSTDYVFDGERAEPYAEDDEPRPIQEYGRSKLAGEERVREANPLHYVVRSAWIYGPGGKNFLSKLPALVAAGTPIKAVEDQIGSPTYAPDLAEAIARLLGSRRYGTYHVVNEGACSFAEFCRFCLDAAGLEANVEDVLRADLGRPAARPWNTSLTGQAWRAAGFPPLRSWQDAAAAFARAAATSPAHGIDPAHGRSHGRR